MPSGIVTAEVKNIIAIDHILCGICGGCVAVCPEFNIKKGE